MYQSMLRNPMVCPVNLNEKNPLRFTCDFIFSLLKIAFIISGKQEKLQSEETASREQHRSLLGKNTEEKRGSRGEVAISKAEGGLIGRHSESRGDLNSGSHDSLQKDSRRMLRLKIKKHNPESQEGEAPTSIVDERGKSGKGHRSKRKRASPPAQKSVFNEDEDVSLSREDNLLDEMLDASWILKKLGKDAKGKKVQIHEASDNSWYILDFSLFFCH